MKDQIVGFIVEAADEINETLEHKLPIEQGVSCMLFGNGGTLDSMSLVSIVVAVEQRLEDELDISVVLADEKAMSQRNSPFLSIGTLADYICALAPSKQEVTHG